MSFNYLFFFLASAFIFSSCMVQDENLHLEKGEPMVDNALQFREVSPHCPELTEYDLLELPSDPTWVELAVGVYTGLHPFEGSGRWDLYMNCPVTPFPECQLACNPTIGYFGPSDGYGFTLCDLEVEYGINFFEDNIISVEEQELIINHIIMHAQENAPTCPNSNIKMSPVSYNVYQDWIIGPPTGNDCFIILGYNVLYMPPCKRE